MGLELDGKVK